MVKFHIICFIFCYHFQLNLNNHPPLNLKLKNYLLVGAAVVLEVWAANKKIAGLVWFDIIILPIRW